MVSSISRCATRVKRELGRLLPARFATSLNSRGGQFAGLLLAFNLAIGLLLIGLDLGRVSGMAISPEVADAS